MLIFPWFYKEGVAGRSSKGLMLFLVLVLYTNAYFEEKLLVLPININRTPSVKDITDLIKLVLSLDFEISDSSCSYTLSCGSFMYEKVCSCLIQVIPIILEEISKK